MNNSNTLGLNEFGMESKMLRDIDMYISLSNYGNCIIMPAIIEKLYQCKIQACSFRNELNVRVGRHFDQKNAYICYGRWKHARA
jgi:hypothetical protein